MTRGWQLIIGSLVVTIILYVRTKMSYPASDWTQLVTQLTGLLGILTLSWGFVLSIRHRVLERLFGGLDLAYRAHHIVGGVSLILLLQHPVFLIVGALPHNSLVLYLLPLGTLEYTLGQLSLYFMLFLLILTFYVPLPYRYWKWSHEWMGIVIILGGLHSVLIVSDVSRDVILKLWIVGWSVVATIAYFYKRFLYYKWQPSAIYTVKKIGHSADLVVVSLTTKQQPLVFSPGQYGFFALPDKPRDEHAFSILGSESDKLIIGFKVMANFTKKVAELAVGDTIIVKGPYGSFGTKMDGAKHAVWIAGGIGITPFLSMARAVKRDQTVQLYFCAKVMPASVITEPFSRLAQENPNFLWLACETSKSGRLTAKKILDETGNDLRAVYLLCGPKPMMEGLASELAIAGVKRSHIVYEDFGFK